MAKDFYTRLRNYYNNVAAVLKGEADASSIFPNTSDIGVSRENIYVKFLKHHIPSKCNVFLGGFVFHEDGSESNQIDVLITTDTVPQFNFLNQDSGGKSFSPVEGTLGIVSVKSNLDKAQLFDSLLNIASIPPTKNLGEGSPIPNYDDWPYKVIFASKGLESLTILGHLESFYSEHQDIPINRRPNLIHVAGKYVISRVTRGQYTQFPGKEEQLIIQEGIFSLLKKDSDLQGINLVLHHIQKASLESNYILYSSIEMMKKLYGLK